MMKTSLLILMLLFTHILTAQIFREIGPYSELEPVSESSVAFVDVDNDNDLDLIFSGTNEPRTLVGWLYLNDGNGLFTKFNRFASLWQGSMAFADVDGDGDIDGFVSGAYSTGEISVLFLNNGSGQFTPNTESGIENVRNGITLFFDADGDNDSDLLISGFKDSIPITKLYSNDGLGNFSEIIGNPFEGVTEGSVAIADVDGDNDEDFVLTGTNSINSIAKLYLNDGLGNFSLHLNTPFLGVCQSSIAFADVDNDNDQDLFITGDTDSSKISKLYLNDGFGNFLEKFGDPFIGVSSSSIAFADIDGDNDQDLLITGLDSNSNGISNLFRNDGAGNFSLITDKPLIGVRNGAVSFADIDSDGDFDLLISGQTRPLPSTKLYLNDGVGNFAEFRGPFEGVLRSCLAFADVDNDSDEDLLISGENTLGEPSTTLYANDGFGNFNEVKGTSFLQVGNSSVAFSDIDKDNDMDVMISGSPDWRTRKTKLFINDGRGSFAEKPTPLENVAGSLVFEDIDGDKDEDLFFAGSTEFKLYRNDGYGNLLEITGTTFGGLRSGSAAFSDVDGDDDPDLLISGGDISSIPMTRLFKNDGIGNFSEVTGTAFQGVGHGKIAFADVDGDGDKDVLISGVDVSLAPVTKLYKNDGVGVFSEVIGTPFDAVNRGSVSFADVDGDQDYDVLISGLTKIGIPVSKLYFNDGEGNFSKDSLSQITGVSLGCIAFSDVDGDNDKDFVITGLTKDYNFRIAKLYINHGLTSSLDMNSESLSTIQIYPNPNNSNILHVNLNGVLNAVANVSIYNLNGSLKIQQKAISVKDKQVLTIDIASLTKGSYFIVLDDGKNRQVSKFLVQ